MGLSSGYNPHRFIELLGGTAVLISNYEPDPLTFRDEYYYNSRTNQLFKLIRKDARYAYWKSVSVDSQ